MDLNRAAELKYGRRPEIEKQLRAAEERSARSDGGGLLREAVTEKEIAQIISRWTGIPLMKLVEGEREKLLKLETLLHERIVGQDEAVEKVADAILRARAGIKDPRRPVGSFIFLGPTGVGKTELAKTLARVLFDSEDSIIRIDMSEYMEKHAVSRLIGAPPGYVGYEEGGQLTEAVRRKPYSVVLFDEIEKAHRDVFNVLLQILDDGRITDAQGRTVDFKNSIIIMTSNIGSVHLLEGIGAGGEMTETAREQVQQELRLNFRPEFLNRVDDIIIFKPLSAAEIAQIVDLMLTDLQARLDERRITLELTKAAKEFIARGGYDPVFGARPLRRFIEKHLETRLARSLLSGNVLDGARVRIDREGDSLTVTWENPAESGGTGCGNKKE